MPARYVLLFILVLIASFAQAEVYQWVAEDGSVTYKDTPPPAAKKKRKVKVYREGDFAAAPPVAAKPAEQPGNRRTERPSPPPVEKKTRLSGTVEIFVTGWCGYCRKAQQYMTEKGIR